VVLKDPVWALLTEAQQQTLAVAEALIKGKAESTLQRLAENPLPPIWQGLTALVQGDTATASIVLNPLASPDSDASPQVRTVVRYYLGVIAAQGDQWEAALAHWQAAQSDGFNPPRLRRNISAVAYHQALQAQQTGQPQQAQKLLELVSDPGSHVRGLAQQLSWEAGYAAAQKSDWQQALANWQQAEQAGDDSRRLLFNLALAYQHQEKFWQAADSWRTLLRRRPRKADHPDALTDQQVARIWQNVAENYSKAGHYEEAITTYRNALKWAPENLEIRLKLVDALQSEGRWQAPRTN
jgi:tetratricopeptide (TPR) repeat protein